MSLKRIFLKEIYFRVFPALRISEDFDGGDDDNDDFRSQCVAIYCNSLAIISSVCNLEKAAWYKMISAAMQISNEKKTSNKKVIAWTKRLLRQKEQKSWTKWEKSCLSDKKSCTWLSSSKHLNYVISIISTGTLSSGAWKLGELDSLSLRCCLRQVMPIIIIILLHIHIIIIDYSADYHYHIDYWL